MGRKHSMDIIATPFLWALKGLNEIFGNYALTILIFTLLVNLLLSPLTVKQQKSQAKQAKIRPKLDALKEKYGNDKMKYQTAMQELYQKENISMTGGCLPLIIRMVLLMGVYYAIRILLGEYGITFLDSKTVVDENLFAPVAEQFQLFGLNLAEQPVFDIDIFDNFKPIWIIPILSGVAAYLSSFLSQIQQKHINPQAAEMAGSMKGMMLMMPLLSVWISFGLPAAVGFYWICSNIINMLIMLVVNYFYSPNKIIAKETVKNGKARRMAEQQKSSRA